MPDGLLTDRILRTTIPAMKAFAKTLWWLVYNPDPKRIDPEWRRSDYIALALVSLILALVYGFWPL